MNSEGLLQQVYRLNNEGVALLSSSSLKESKLAIKLFNEAITLAASFKEKSSDTEVASTRQPTLETGIWELCLYADVPIPSLEDDAFYYFGQGIYLRPDVFVDHMNCNERSTISFFLAVLLLNTALGCCQVARACQYREKAERIFHKALHFYKTAHDFFSDINQSLQMHSKAILFFIVASQNNYSWVCLSLGMHAECRKSQALVAPLVQEGTQSFPADAASFVEEFLLNTTVWSMTDNMSSLPAAAA